jgi:predicted porin
MKFSLIATVLLFCVATAAWAGSDWRASISVSEEYNDNVEEERDGEEDFITTVTPALGYRYEDTRLQFDASYSVDWNTYAKGTRDQEFNHDANVYALLDAWESFLFLEVQDTYRLVNEDTTRGEVRDEDSTRDQVQQNMFTFSPFITPRLGDRTSAKVGYAYSNIWYDDEDNELKNIHRGFVDGDHELSDRTSLLAGYSYTMELSEDDTLDRHILYTGARHAYSEKGNLRIKIGPMYSRYRDRDTSSAGVFWDAGLNHDFGAVQLGVSTGITFDDDPDTGETYERKYGTVTLSKAWPRTTASVFSTFEDYEESADSDSDDTESGQRVAIGTSLSYELTPRLTASTGVVHDFELDTDDDTKRWYANVGLSYAVTERISLRAWYRFKDSDSDDPDEEFTVNRTGLQLAMTF